MAINTVIQDVQKKKSIENHFEKNIPG
jgi:hypothetical protein